MIAVACPQCRCPVQVPDGKAGSFAPCPGCGNLVTLPAGGNGSKSVRNLWTLVYIVVGCAFAALSFAVGTGYFGSDLRAASAHLKIREISQACQRYSIEHDGQYPPNLDILTTKDAEGRGPYLKGETIIDPWGRLYEYQFTENDVAGGQIGPLIYCIKPSGERIGNRDSRTE
jgi:hypothetical protein